MQHNCRNKTPWIINVMSCIGTGNRCQANSKTKKLGDVYICSQGTIHHVHVKSLCTIGVYPFNRPRLGCQIMFDCIMYIVTQCSGHMGPLRDHPPISLKRPHNFITCGDGLGPLSCNCRLVWGPLLEKRTSIYQECAAWESLKQWFLACENTLLSKLEIDFLKHCLRTPDSWPAGFHHQVFSSPQGPSGRSWHRHRSNVATQLRGLGWHPW